MGLKERLERLEKAMGEDEKGEVVVMVLPEWWLKAMPADRDPETLVSVRGGTPEARRKAYEEAVARVRAILGKARGGQPAQEEKAK